MMMLVVLSIGLRVNKMILKYQSGETRTNERHMMKRAKSKGIVRYSKSKPDDFLRKGSMST